VEVGESIEQCPNSPTVLHPQSTHLSPEKLSTFTLTKIFFFPAVHRWNHQERSGPIPETPMKKFFKISNIFGWNITRNNLNGTCGETDRTDKATPSRICYT